MIARLTISIALCGLVVAFAGCNGDPMLGYSLDTMYRDDVSSVYVPMFIRGSDVYRQGEEYRLTEAVIKQIQADTPYRISDRDRADTLLTGELVSITRTVLATNRDTGNPIEQEIIVRVAFTWTNLDTGEVLADVRGLDVAMTYAPDLNEDFFQGSQDVYERAARRIVEYMETPWATPAAEDEDDGSVTQ